MSEITVTAANFEDEVLKSDKPVLLDFWASWCGPCTMLAPVIAEIAEEKADSLKVGKVNVDDEQELAEKFGISSIPTVLVFKNGELSSRSVGFKPKAELLSMI